MPNAGNDHTSLCQRWNDIKNSLNGCTCTNNVYGDMTGAEAIKKSLCHGLPAPNGCGCADNKNKCTCNVDGGVF